MSEITHLDGKGRARMVDVTGKDISSRRAVAAGRIELGRSAFAALRDGALKKGDVLAVAQVAAIQAAKKTPEWIPLCHPLPLGGVDVNFTLDEEACAVDISVAVRVRGATGVEMEALTAVAAACLTIYDMCKAITKDMVIGPIRLLEKSGGESGTWQARSRSIFRHPRESGNP